MTCHRLRAQLASHWPVLTPVSHCFDLSGSGCWLEEKYRPALTERLRCQVPPSDYTEHIVQESTIHIVGCSSGHHHDISLIVRMLRSRGAFSYEFDVASPHPEDSSCMHDTSALQAPDALLSKPSAASRIRSFTTSVNNSAVSLDVSAAYRRRASR